MPPVPFDRWRKPTPITGEAAHLLPMKSLPASARLSIYQSASPVSLQGDVAPSVSSKPLADVLLGTSCHGRHAPTYFTLAPVARTLNCPNTRRRWPSANVPVYSAPNLRPSIFTSISSPSGSVYL